MLTVTFLVYPGPLGHPGIGRADRGGHAVKPPIYTPGPWHYVSGGVWTTPAGPDDGGQCVATRKSDSTISPTQKDANMRLCAEAPALLNECDQYRAALQRLKDHVGPDGRKIIDAALARRAPC